MSDVSLREKTQHLTIDWGSAEGSVAVTGAVPEGDEDSLREAIEVARQAKGDVVIILQHAVVDELEEAVAEVAEQAEPDSTPSTMSALEAIASAVARALEQRESMSDLIEQLTPKAISSSPAVLQARRNAAARLELFEEFGFLTAGDVSDLAGSTATNRSALATRWRKEGRIFAIPRHGTLYYPLFQFGEDGRPLPAIAEVLAAFKGAGMSDWEVALWFTSGNGWLDDRRPVDVLAPDPEAVVVAASHETDEIAG
jgi:hypothetical protein